MCKTLRLGSGMYLEQQGGWRVGRSHILLDFELQASWALSWGLWAILEGILQWRDIIKFGF